MPPVPHVVAVPVQVADEQKGIVFLVFDDENVQELGHRSSLC